MSGRDCPLGRMLVPHLAAHAEARKRLTPKTEPRQVDIGVAEKWAQAGYQRASWDAAAMNDAAGTRS